MLKTAPPTDCSQCEGVSGVAHGHVVRNPEMAGMLEAERERLHEQIDKLTRSQAQVQCYLDRVKETQAQSPA